MSAGSLLNASVGAYRLVDFLGAGGMGEVYRAVHSNLGRVVAIKVLAAPGTKGLDQRFQNEARIQSSIQHPNIVAVYDFLDLGGKPCLVMEYVDGETVDERVRRTGPLSTRTALELFEAAVQAVDHLHRRGIVHRDLKCGNMKIASTGQLKLLDFGLAKGLGTPKLTATGYIVGTLEYMAPEQLLMQPADHRTDIWALGVILYEMVTGRVPFAASDVMELIGRVSRGEYFAPSTLQPGIPPSIDRIVAACLKAKPEERIADAPALLELVRDARRRLATPTMPDAPAPGPSAFARTAEWLRRPLAVRLGAGLGAVSVLVAGALLFRPGPGSGTETPPAPPPPAPTTAAVAPPTGSCGVLPVTEASQNQRSVMISVVGGTAAVYCDGALIGTTPLEVRVEVGAPVMLILRQDGFDDEPIDFTATANTTGFLVTMRPTATRSSTTEEPPPLPLAMIAGWLPAWFRRRKSTAASAKATRVAEQPAATEKATNDGAAVLGPSATIKVSVISDVGCVRDSNEDAIGYCRPEAPEEMERMGALLVVADGMGGHSAGEVASRLAVETVVELYAEDNGDPQAALTRAVRQAHTRIRDEGSDDPARAGMGTTCTALVIRQGWAHCAHVGDSRLYLIRDDSILQMTEDDSAVFDLVKKGVIDRDHARQHPDRNVIIKALGSRPTVEVSEWKQPLFVRDGDRFLASSDGLHDLVSDEELRDAVVGYDPDTACRQLVGLARERGGHDNISVGIMAISAERHRDLETDGNGATPGAAA